MVREYYQALNNSDYAKVIGFFQDSIRFNEMSYKRTFSKLEYRHLFEWDSVFHPKYEILELEEKGDELHLLVSKECERINFLHEGPFFTNEVFKIEGDAIHQIDVVEYVDFNDSLWTAKRESLVSWISEHHPELDGFIYDQTKEGAIKFKKAIDVFKNRMDSVSVKENNSNQ
ncbi:hypothetical protein [Muricauda brasiliensis]|uniref:hypothetical protein n=1 Tax=Muricauda brasiliensis TaxID=2162892 RepID=UPI00131EE06C|nr:hypothetical protein [Muricauda brasiliensis]